MKSKTRWFMYVTLCLLAAVAASGISAWAKVGHPTQEEPIGKLTVVGKVKVDGKPAATGDVFHSSSTATTAKGSSAVVSLGKLGRVEVMEGSEMKLSYGTASLTGWLRDGSASINKDVGMAANVSTKDGEIIARGDAAADFTVDVECGNTLVTVRTGEVQLIVKGVATKIGAGTMNTAGTPKSGCTRPTAP